MPTARNRSTGSAGALASASATAALTRSAHSAATATSRSSLSWKWRYTAGAGEALGALVGDRLERRVDQRDPQITVVIRALCHPCLQCSLYGLRVKSLHVYNVHIGERWARRKGAAMVAVSQPRTADAAYP